MRYVLIAVALVALEAAATADPTPTTPEDLYAAGQVAYAHGDFPAAIERWQAAYQLSGESVLLFNLAQALRLSGDCAKALSTYKRFVADETTDPTSEQHALAEDFVRELEPTCGERLSPHALPANARPHEDRRSGRTLKVTGFVTGSAGAAAIVTGLLFGRRARTLGEEVTRACAVSCDWSVQKAKDAAGRSDAAIGYGFDALGAAAIAGGAILYYLGDRRSVVTVTPRSREGGAVVSWNGSW